MLPKQNKLRLPKSLIDQLGGEDALSGDYRSRPRSGSRKEIRKATRVEKKVSKTGSLPQKRLKRTQYYDEDSDEPKNVKRASAKPQREPKEDTSKPKSILKRRKKLEAVLSAKTKSRSISPPVKVSRSTQNKLDEDDNEIAALEKKLGLKGKKSLPQSFKNDGLDELLQGLGEEEEKSDVQNKRKRKSEGDEWLEQKRKQARKYNGKPAKTPHEDGSEGSEEGSEEGGEANDDDGVFNMPLHGLDFPDDASEDFREVGDEEEPLDLENDFDGFDSDEDQSEDLDAPLEHLRVRENPYIAPSTGSAPLQKYIPPSLRKPASSDSEALTRLRRQTQGLVNRLTESNLISMLGDIEKLYRDNPRQHVTSTLVDLLLVSVCGPTSLPDTLIILPAGFIAAVHKIVGTDFGAHIIQRITELFDEYYARANANGDEGPAAATSDSRKETSNLIMLLSVLYNFQVVGSSLIFDYVRTFLEKLSELNAELLLRIIRTSGPQLRQDDPSSLKDIVAMLRPAVAKVGGEENISVRTKFMIETINDLKNNKMRTGGQASAVMSEHTIRMKKILGSLNTRSIKGSEPLRIGLKDIRDSDKKGKWWLVGASWAGNAVDETNGITKDGSSSKKRSAVEDAGTSDLAQLAREQRMNTDIRRAIFVTIMSATDFQDAYMRLMKLKLKKIQEYEIPKVIIKCAGAEKAYNPYYTLIANKFCGDKRLRTSFQFCLWDLFKRMGESDDEEDVVEEDEDDLDMRHIVNLAKMFASLIVEGGLGLGVLKNLRLNYLQPKTKTFLEVLFITVLLQSQKQVEQKRDGQAVVNIFCKARDNPQLISGLQYFLKRVVSKTDIAGGKKREGYSEMGL